jgi:acetyltransferase-like isoleucine patch superfamily enzyme
MKMIIPQFVKIFFWYYYLRFKIRKRGNIIRKGAVMSKDFNCGTKCIIGKNVVIGSNVHLHDGVKIGSGSYIENAEINSNSCIDGSVYFTGHGDGKIRIGRESYIGINCVLDWSDNITIGDFVHVAGPGTGIWTHSSARMCLLGIPLNNKNKDNRPTAPITIESNVYIGGNCILYPGISIGHHSIIAPNSAVNKNVPPYSMVGGVPAKFIKSTKV